MLKILGSCFEIRDQLKAMGCRWDDGAKAWFAPDEVHAQAQGMADAESRRAWQAYLGELPWGKGSLSESTYLAGLRAASLGIGCEEAVSEIHARRSQGGGKKSEGNTRREVMRAFGFVGPTGRADWKPDASARPAEKKEKPVYQNAVLSRVGGSLIREVNLAWLSARSPVEPCFVGSLDFLRSLYGEDERVVVFDTFESQGQWLWGAREGMEPHGFHPAALYETKGKPMNIGGRAFDGHGPDGVWYLCNPVGGDWRWYEEGSEPHWSRRFHGCVTSWRYLVLESDKARAREWVAAAVQLPLRIAAIYTSGGKSVHVLVRLDATSKREWDEWKDEIKPMVITLGADPGCMSAVRLTRLPGCVRGDKPQKLLYLNPRPDMTPIVAKREIRDGLHWLKVARACAASDAFEISPEDFERTMRALDFYGAAVPDAARLRRELGR